MLSFKLSSPPLAIKNRHVRIAKMSVNATTDEHSVDVGRMNTGRDHFIRRIEGFELRPRSDAPFGYTAQNFRRDHLITHDHKVRGKITLVFPGPHTASETNRDNRTGAVHRLCATNPCARPKLECNDSSRQHCCGQRDIARGASTHILSAGLD